VTRERHPADRARRPYGRGRVLLVRVEHDATCPRPDGGQCICRPNVVEHVHKTAKPNP
jgi:hypothetical protein